LKSKLAFETTFGTYVAEEQLGQGGAGIVYGGVDDANNPVAIKVLNATTKDKRRRFKNEIAFLWRNKHKNIVSVIDHGLSQQGPFYIMPRYSGSLRGVLEQKLSPDDSLSLFGKILDGVEAAHLLGAFHRDLKSENILVDLASKTPAVADFGIAGFTDDLLITLVKTDDRQRLANFAYASPEQRTPGGNIDRRADIYALGLMLNEIFTRHVPHGTDYRTIKSVALDFAFLDPIVAKMIKQDANERYPSIDQVKRDIAHSRQEYITFQRLSKITETVIPEGEIDDPLAFNTPKISDVDWNEGTLTVTLDRPVHQKWVSALHNMGSYASVMNIPPQRFNFNGEIAKVGTAPGDAQRVIDHFKDWLPKATARLKFDLEQENEQRRREAQEKLRIQRQHDEARLSLLQNLKF
jgi:serine/threonine protein kinase